MCVVHFKGWKSQSFDLHDLKNFQFGSILSATAISKYTHEIHIGSGMLSDTVFY
jgi:hypothetical protein